jgi:Tfp pilus assembly protein PilV
MKGQIFSFDLIFAVIVLLIIISALAAITTQYALNQQAASQNRDIQIKTQAAMNSLVLTQGVPYNWENLTNHTT